MLYNITYHVLYNPNPNPNITYVLNNITYHVLYNPHRNISCVI